MNVKRTKGSLILVMLLFGSIGLFVRGIDCTSSQIALSRGMIGTLCLVIASFVLKQPLSWKRIRPNLSILIASGIAIGLNWIFLFEAYKYTTIATATICYYFAPVIVMFLSPLILKERLSVIKVACILAAMLGMVLITGVGESGLGQNYLIGVAYGIGAAALYASVMIMNKFLKKVTSLESTVSQLGFASLAILPYILINGGFDIGQLDGQSIILLLIVGVIHTGVGYVIYFGAFQKLSGQTIAAFSYIDPISAIILSSLILREEMTWMQIVGGILILGSTYISEFYSNKKKDMECSISREL